MKICEKASVNSIIENDWHFPNEIGSETSLHKIQSALFALCEPMESEGKHDLAQTIGLLAHVSGMGLQLSEPGTPFRSFAEYGNGQRTANLDDLTQEHLEAIKEAVKRTNNRFMLARLNDVLWIKVRPPERSYAQAAIKSYLNSSDLYLSNAALFMDAKNYTLRAIQLWKQLGADPIIRTEIEEALVKCMFLGKDEPQNFVRFFFFENIVQCFDPVDAQKWIDLGNQLAADSLKQKNFEKARKYSEQVEEIHRRVKDKSNAQKMQVNQTNIFIQEAREMRAAGASAMILQDRYNKAIEAARNTPGMSAEAKVLLSELTEVQKDIPGDLKEISVPIDLKPAIEETINLIREKSFEDAIKIIAFKTVPAKKSDLYNQAKETIKAHPLQALISGVVLDEKGKVIAKRASMNSTQEENLGVVRSQASQHLIFSVTIKGSVLGWAQRELNNRTDFDESLIDSLLYPNPFIPKSRVLQFKRGLMTGFKGDWISAVYILIPQLENSLRHLMQLAGYEMVKMDSDGIQQEKDLNAFIYSDEFQDIVGEDMAFQLQVILTDKIGLNLRNQIAHGLATDGTVLSEVGPFIWSMTLLLCLHFQRQFFRQQSDQTAAE